MHSVLAFLAAQPILLLFVIVGFGSAIGPWVRTSNASQPDQAQASFASTAPVSDFKFSPQEKFNGARSHGVASSSSLYSGRPDYY